MSKETDYSETGQPTDQLARLTLLQKQITKWYNDTIRHMVEGEPIVSEEMHKMCELTDISPDTNFAVSKISQELSRLADTSKEEIRAERLRAYAKANY
jgi:hypothetical protein